MAKRIGTFLAALSIACVALLGAVTLPTLAQNVPCYAQQGGANFVAGSGCSIAVKSGGVLNIESGGAFEIGGTAVTATAAELNALAGTGLSAAELGVIDGVTAGTVVAGKAVVPTTGKTVDEINVTLLKVGTVDKTAAVAAAVATPVAGVAAGYKTARGETALDGSNPTDVATGLTTIVACTLTIKATAAPGVGTSVVTYSWSGATLSLYGWKVTANNDTTLIASTGTETIGWHCDGT